MDQIRRHMYDFDEVIDREGTSCVKHDMNSIVFNTNEVFSMWVADMDFRTPNFIMEAIRKRANHEILGYSFRDKSYFKAQINWFKKSFGWDIKEEDILFSPGVVPAFTLAVLAFTSPGDEVIVQPPVYFPFFSAIEDNGRKLVTNELREEGGYYTMDFDGLRKKISKRTKLFILCSPHNPVGRVWKQEELTELCEICMENNILIVSDEIHADLVFKPARHIPTATLSREIANRTITCVAPSKTFNMAGLATSSVIISDLGLRTKFQKEIDKLHIGYGNVFGNVAAEAAYSKGRNWLSQLLLYLEGNIDFLIDFCKKNIPLVNVYKPQATYLVWLDFRKLGMKGGALKDFIVGQAGLGLNDGPMFGEGGEGFQRINIACPRSVLKQSLEKLESAVNKTIAR